MRTEIGTATFPTFESVRKFIPEAAWWPLPTDEQLKNDDDNVWNKHFFGKEASNANPINYKKAVNTQFGESSGLEEFCEKAQLLNIEVMKGMYEAWNDKMWNDAAGLLIWMSHPAYPSFVWQTYDYYYDPTGAYWGAKKACEHLHLQWNASNNSIKAVNTTAKDLKGAYAQATLYNLDGKEMPAYGQRKQIDVPASDIAEAFTLNFNPSNLAFGKKVAASSSTPSRHCSLVADGGAGSRWESNYSDPQWIYVDLGKKEKIETVVLKWEAARAKEYELQVSDDGKKWRTVYSNRTGEGGTDVIKLSPLSVRYVKMSGISRATEFGYSLYEFEIYGRKPKNMEELSPLHFIRLELTDAKGQLISDNFYWRNGVNDLDYTPLNTLPETHLTCKLIDKSLLSKGVMKLSIKNNSGTVSFANRLRLINKATGERVLPILMSDNYVTLMPGEEKIISLEADRELLKGGVNVLVKQYGKAEKCKLEIGL